MFEDRTRRNGMLVVLASVALTAGSLPFYVPWAEAQHGTPTGPVVAAGQVVDESQPHTHLDESTKNEVSRAHLTSDETKDPTTAKQASTARDAVKAQRAEADPTLKPIAAPRRATTPGDRYAMAGGCYALQAATTGRWVVRSGSNYVASATSQAAAAPVHFQATDLGVYLLYGVGRTFAADVEPVRLVATPSEATEWTATYTNGRLTFARGKNGLAVGSDGKLRRGAPTPFVLRTTTGCETYPEVDVNVTGDPTGGTTAYQEVRGYLDAHVHGMAFEFLGGQVHCGRPWHKYGVEYALKDCVDHQVANGNGALLENVLKGGAPVGSHDPVGWPTFKDWPAPDSLTHEGTYYKWLERSWRGGQRILVNLFVENNQLCTIYPLKKNSCNDMDSVRLQAKDIKDLERYIDAQNGGPGRGWFRIVTDPYQARQVINAGKLAVVLGMETSVPFGCSTTLDVPECSLAQIDRQVDEMWDLGVRQMELVNKFDNALAGVAGDTGGVAPLINAANFLENGSFWDMRQCKDPEAANGVHDRAQLTAPTVVPEQDALFGAIAELYLPIKLPLYAAAPHCNNRGLTTLGEHTITRMASKGMIFDPDHMSVKARKSSLDVTEKLGYSGVVSSHSWSTPDAYPRIYRAGGVITPYAGDSAGFVDKWKQHLAWADPRYYFGFGYGADINGLGAQGNPRGADAKNKVTYPFTGLGGVRIDRQTSGSRVYDVNVDGVAHYGLYPDWIEDLRRQAGDAIVDDMARGPEAYLQMWERALGVGNDACRDAAAIKRDTVVRGVKKGASVRSVLETAGQPHTRLGSTFGYCAKTSTGATTRVTITFDAAGKVVKAV